MNFFCLGVEVGSSRHKRVVSIALSHHAAILLAGVKIRDAQSYSLPVNGHVAFDKPLIPHLAIIRLSPETDFDL
jgi:hypothetical protein